LFLVLQFSFAVTVKMWDNSISNLQTLQCFFQWFLFTLPIS